MSWLVEALWLLVHNPEFLIKKLKTPETDWTFLEALSKSQDISSSLQNFKWITGLVYFN